ncbi:hypothetical protein QCD85_16965 [Paenibacillus sp. PsM32]|uniref:hypothetical protein n=1 Tax=Paenibacillus sp. PsM32 TaxID=3030536 RepID=UPI00263B412C|nr:hypothetical protein [Paenibacillus sp. PsM32]MDN4619803.1 hypothetical protein [Paenibacillus sp. PsM32]
MLSPKVQQYFKEQNAWYEEASTEYAGALETLQIPLDSDFAQFYLHAETGPTFYSRHQELYHICWFVLYSNYDLSIHSARETLKLPEQYLPLDAFVGEGGYFYNRQTDQVLELSLGQRLQDFWAGQLQPQWQSFNSFLEWFFELDHTSHTLS